MSRFDDYLDAVMADAKVLLNSTVKQGSEEAKAILEAHVDNSKIRLERWTILLTHGHLKKREFELLINNQITLGRMRLRTVEVIGKRAALDFRNSLRALFIDKAFDIFL